MLFLHCYFIISHLEASLSPILKCLHCVSKKHPDIIDNLKKDFNNFGTNIPDTTGHQTSVQVPTSPSVCFCTTWGNQNKRNITFLFKAVWLF